jgi:hypothetical protein
MFLNLAENGHFVSESLLEGDKNPVIKNPFLIEIKNVSGSQRTDKEIILLKLNNIK